MTQEHPITPPPELIVKWAGSMCGYYEAARWGADQELMACINYFHEYDPSWGEDSELITGLRAARRSKPPSLKEQALEALDQADKGLNESEWQQRSDTIRRALELLSDV